MKNDNVILFPRPPRWRGRGADEALARANRRLLETAESLRRLACDDPTTAKILVASAERLERLAGG